LAEFLPPAATVASTPAEKPAKAPVTIGFEEEVRVSSSADQDLSHTKPYLAAQRGE
jgi:hypothetical protein